MRSEEVEREKYRRIWGHDDYRTYSPGQALLEQLDVVNFLRQCGVRSILDAGCGSGKASRHIMTRHSGEFDVSGFDIADNCLDSFFDPIKDRYLTVGCLWNRADFKSTYDAVICTDVMEHIPKEKVAPTLANLRDVARKAAFFGIHLQPDNFGPAVLGEPLHLTVEPPSWWLERIAEAGFRVHWSDVAANDGTPIWLFCAAIPSPP